MTDADDPAWATSRARATRTASFLRARSDALLAAGQDESAALMWRDVLEDEDASAFERAAALEQLAEIFHDEDPDGAEECYRLVLTDHPSLSGTAYVTEIGLSELLITKGDAASLDEAEDLLESWFEHRNRVPNLFFRWHLALIRLAEARHDSETMQRAARTALRLATEANAPPHRRRRGAIRADGETLRRLQRLSEQ